MEETRELIQKSIVQSLMETALSPSQIELKNFVQALQTNEEGFLSTLLDKISRKKTTDHTNLQSSRILVNFTLKLKKTCYKNVRSELDIADVDEKSLEAFIKLLNELGHTGPRLIFVIFRVRGRKHTFYQSQVNFVFEYLCRETELHVVLENDLIIPEFEEKLENGNYEDGSIILFGNVHNYENLQESFVNDQMIYYNRPWIDLLCSTHEFADYSNRIVDCDIDSIFKYSSLLSVLSKPHRVFGQPIRVFGGSIKELFEFTTKAFKVEKTPKDGLNRILAVGGGYALTKLRFILNARQFFKSIYLTGELGLLYAAYKHNLSIRNMSEDIKEYFSEFDKAMADATAEIKYCSSYYLISEEQKKDLTVNDNDKRPYTVTLKTHSLSVIDMSNSASESFNLNAVNKRQIIATRDSGNATESFMIMDPAFVFVNSLLADITSADSCLL